MLTVCETEPYTTNTAVSSSYYLHWLYIYSLICRALNVAVQDGKNETEGAR